MRTYDYIVLDPRVCYNDLDIYIGESAHGVHERLSTRPTGVYDISDTPTR